MSDFSRRPSSTGVSTPNCTTEVLRSSLASPINCLLIRPIRLLDSHSQSSGRVSRLASRVDTMSLMETRSFHQLPPPIAVSPPGLLLNTEDCVLPKSFSPSPTLSMMDTDTPWYRYCRPTAPIPPVSDSIEAGSPVVTITNPTIGSPGADVPIVEDSLDQENLSPPQPPSAILPFVQPLTAVSNILQSPVVFGERLPKWSVLRRSESNPMPPPQPSLRPSASAELLNRISLRSPLRGEEEYLHPHSRPIVITISPRDSPQTPPVSVFDRRRSWFTSRAAPGVTRPRVLKHGPVLPLNLVASRTNDLPSLKRTATNGYNTCEESSVKKSRVHSLVPSERSAFLPVAHSRPTGLIDSSSDSSSIAMDDGDDDEDDDVDEERKPINLLPPPPLPSNSI